MPINTQLGLVKETTWGTPLTVTRFFEFESESIEPEAGRWESSGLRASTRGLREDRFVPYISGWAGTIKLPVLTKGFGVLLEHMLGQVATTGPTDATYTHTASVASLCGKGFTMQSNNPLGACGDTNQAITWEGGKIASWSLSQEKGGALTFEASLLFEAGTTATALATASYSTGMEPIPWTTTAVTIGGTSVPVDSWKVSVDNKLAADRMKIRNSAQRLEPVETDWREITFEADCDFDDLTQLNRVISGTVAGSLAAVVITANGPTLLGVSTYPGVTISMDKVRFDQATANIDGPGIISQKLQGKALVPNSGNFLTVAYRTADTTP